MVMRLPEGDRISLARDKIYADLRVACGGRIAEDLIFGEDKITTGVRPISVWQLIWHVGW